MEIPKQLHGWRFVLIPRGAKDPFEKDWQKTNNYAHDDPKLKAHLAAGGNYGILAQENHCIIDCDTPELERLVKENLPETFTVLSPGHNSQHFYYNYTGTVRTIPIIDKTLPKDKQNIGHVRIGGGQCVAPGSTHSNGKRYEVCNDKPIASVTEQQIREVLAPFIADRSRAAERVEGQRQYGGELDFNILQLVNTTTLTQRGDEFFGSHPTHGSNTGQNFHINAGKNQWYCFRCCSGGGPLQLLAVVEGIISCDEAVSGGLAGDRFRKTVEIAVERGLISKSMLEKQLEELSKPLSFQDVSETLESTVKRDRPTKTVTFAANILTYTEQEQINVLMAAESSTGKSYIPIELAAYFPEEDVIILGGASPTAFFHEISGGDFATWDPEKKVMWVDLSKKILIFLDQPHDLLLQKLRPFLSHDQKIITYKISDRSQKAGLRTKTVKLIGYATVEFCTATFQMDQQERTRVFQLSPETSAEKIEAAIDLLLEKKSDRDAFSQRLNADPQRQRLMKRVRDVKNAGIRDVVIPPSLKATAREQWRELHPYFIPRHTRDMDRLLSLIKARALLNWRLRRKLGFDRIAASDEDMAEAFAIYGEIAEANELGLAPQVYEIFQEVIQPIGTAKVSETEVVTVGVTRQEILREYYCLYHRPLPERRLRKEVLESLDASGQIRQEQDPKDKRRDLVYPQVAAPISRARGRPPEDKGDLGNRSTEVGVNEWTENPPVLHPEVHRRGG